LKALLDTGESVTTTVAGQSPLHLAVGWPEGVRLLLSSGTDPNVMDGIGYLPLHYALQINCFESTASLLAAHSSFTSRGTSCFTRGFLSKPYPEIQDLVVNSLAKRRELIRAHLEASAKWAELSKGLTLRADITLDEIGISIITELAMPEITWASSWQRDTPTVYHNLGSWTIELLERLYNHNFRDINAYDIWGLTPLMLACNGFYGRNNDAIRWFLSKGCHPLHKDVDDNYNSFQYFAEGMARKEDLSIIPSFITAASHVLNQRPSAYFYRWHSQSLRNSKQGSQRKPNQGYTKSTPRRQLQTIHSAIL
jgi:hypothetical protein